MIVKPMIAGGSGFHRPLTVPCDLKRHDSVVIVGLTKIAPNQIKYSLVDTRGGKKRDAVWNIPPTSVGRVQEVNQSYSGQLTAHCVFENRVLVINVKNLKRVDKPLET